MSKHENLYNDYYKGFHSEVWGVNDETKLPLFTASKEIEISSKARLVEENSYKPIKVTLHLLNSIMIVCE